MLDLKLCGPERGSAIYEPLAECPSVFTGFLDELQRVLFSPTLTRHDWALGICGWQCFVLF